MQRKRKRRTQTVSSILEGHTILADLEQIPSPDECDKNRLMRIDLPDGCVFEFWGYTSRAQIIVTNQDTADA